MDDDMKSRCIQTLIEFLIGCSPRTPKAGSLSTHLVEQKEEHSDACVIIGGAHVVLEQKGTEPVVV
jgi:hypothetical protein